MDIQIEQAAKRVRESEELNPKGKILQTLFKIDDLLGSYRGGQARALEKLMVSGRHQAITVVVLSQQWRALSPVIRKQISHLGLWAGPRFETDAIREELVGQGGLDKESFDLAFNIATNKNMPFSSSRWVARRNFSRVSPKGSSVKTLTKSARLHGLITGAQTEQLFQNPSYERLMKYING